MITCDYCRNEACDNGMKCGNRTLAQAMGDINKPLPAPDFFQSERPRHYSMVKPIMPEVELDDTFLADEIFKMNAKLEKELYSKVCNEADAKAGFTLETMAEIARQMTLKSTIFVVSVKHLPDDCYGILYVRPEDAEKWKKKN